MGKLKVSTALWMVFAWMLSVPVIAQEQKQPPNPIAEIRVSPTRIDWSPSVNAERWELTFTGPGDLFRQSGFEAGKSPSLSLFDSAGDRLPDGTYTWELRGTRPPRGARGEAASARQAGGTIGKRMAAGTARPLVISGHFSIRNGSFVEMPVESPKPPGPSIGTKDLVNSGNFVVQGNACIGSSCATNDANYSALKIKSVQPNILFDGIALPEGGGGSSQDWALMANPSGAPQFSLADFTNASFPFSVAAGAPSNSLYVASNGNVGLGTSTPTSWADLHVYTSATENASAVFGPDPNSGPSFAIGYAGFTFGRGAAGLNVFPDASATPPNPSFRFMTNTIERMIITNTGDIGIGTTLPSTKLHVFGNGGTNKLLVEEASATTTPREILELRNNGGTIVILKDTSQAPRWSFGTSGTSFVTDNQANAGVELSLTATGNLTIAGTLTQGSSREIKTDFVTLDPKEVLARVSSLPVSLWSYKSESAVRHVGPMAEDFHQVFGLGADDKHIAPGDQAGVALLAVQGLNQVVQDNAQEVATLRRENADLAKRIEVLEALLSTMLDRQGAQAPK